jgi:broad specificity phosphatase PhoE
MKDKMNPETSDKIVYFVRHGQSKGNISPVFQSPKSPLSDLGRKQAKLIAKRSAKISFEKLIVSPLTRTKETATAITATTGKTPEYSDFFVERIKPTRIVDKSYDDEAANKLFEKWEKSLYTPGLRAEDGENFDDLMVRAKRALDFLKNRPEKTIVVVTHGFFLRTIIFRVITSNSFTSQAYQDFLLRVSMENTGLSVLKYSATGTGSGWGLWIYNDHAHLG